jgi:hypothetical protein
VTGDMPSDDEDGAAEGGPELVGLDEKQHLGDGDNVPLQGEA